MKVQSVMSPRVTTVSADTSVRKLWSLIFSKHINAIPVIDKKKKLIGIVTKDDIIKALYPDQEEFIIDLTGVADYEELEGKVREIGDKKVADVMCRRVVFTRVDTPIMRALSRMIVRDLAQLPVVSTENHVVGILTKSDIFYALFKKSSKNKKK